MKLHVSLKVEDLDEAIRFYSGLFGQQPVIVKDDYVKWDVDEPAVNFVVEPRRGRGKTGLDHLGIQVETAEELEAVSGRMKSTDYPYLEVAPAQCCYAKSDKAWVKGAASEKWEAFLTHSHDGAAYGDDRETLLDGMPLPKPSGTAA